MGKQKNENMQSKRVIKPEPSKCIIEKHEKAVADFGKQLAGGLC